MDNEQEKSDRDTKSVNAVHLKEYVSSHFVVFCCGDLPNQHTHIIRTHALMSVNQS